eukprot:jgi/Picre1/28238/NNA_003644.t1
MSTTRHSFRHQGQTVYEWDQTLSDVNLYILTPPYLDKELTEIVKAEESLWTFDPDTRELHIQLCKAEEARVWDCVFVGHQQEQSGDPEGDKKRLMLERFQRDHPGFDFLVQSLQGTCLIRGRFILVENDTAEREDHQSTVDEYSAGVDGERGVLDVTCVGFGSRGVDALRRVARVWVHA